MKNFLSQFKTWIHVAAGLIASAAVAYATNDAIHKAVNTIIGPNKKLVALAGAVAAIGLAYTNAKKQ